jgi:hypothetical protein
MDEREIEDYYDKKEKKNMRKVKITYLCDIDSVDVPVTPLTKKLLEDMIEDEMVTIKVKKTEK